MHELGVLCQAVRTVDNIAKKNHIKSIKYMTLEVGHESGYLPIFFEKLFPSAIESFPRMKSASLKIEMISGKELRIKDIGY